MSNILRAEEIDASKLLFSRNAYSYGPNGRIIYTDYERPRCPMDVFLGPFYSPFGLSAYNGDQSRVSVGVRIDDPLVVKQFKQFDSDAQQVMVETMKDPKLAWSLPFALTADNVFRLWQPTVTEDSYGATMRFNIRSDNEVLKCLFLQKDVDEDGLPAIENISSKSNEELFTIFGPRTNLCLLARLKGFAVTKTSIQSKWDVVQLIEDKSNSSTSPPEDNRNFHYENPIDISFFH